MTYQPIKLYQAKRTDSLQLSTDSNLESLATKLLPIPLDINIKTTRKSNPAQLNFLPWYETPSGKIIYIPPPDEKEHDPRKDAPRENPDWAPPPPGGEEEPSGDIIPPYKIPPVKYPPGDRPSLI
jgi:hypothetical protein